MPNENIKRAIEFAVDGSPAKFQEVIQQEIKSRIFDKISDMKKAVASNILGKSSSQETSNENL